jgi:hypothetical protein
MPYLATRKFGPDNDGPDDDFAQHDMIRESTLWVGPPAPESRHAHLLALFGGGSPRPSIVGGHS